MDSILIIHKLLTGVATRTELLQLNTWLASSEANLAVFREIASTWYDSSWTGELTFSEAEFQDEFKKLMVKIDATKPAVDHQSPRLKLLTGLLIGAAAILTILAAAVHLQGLKQEPRVSQSDVLRFENEPVKDIARYLSAAHGVVLEMPQEIRDCQFSGTFGNVSIDEIVETISISLHVDFQHLNDGYYRIYGRSCFQ